MALVALLVALAIACASAKTATLAPGGALREVPFFRIKHVTRPMVVVYYDSDLADPREVSMALQVAVAASKRVPSFSFFKCDTAASSNSDQAEESMLRGGVFIFSRTPHDGIDEFLLPLEVDHLVRYLHLRGVVGNPADIVPFTGEADLAALLDPRGPRPRAVLARFGASWCAFCARMDRVIEAAATFFRGRVHVVDIDCSAASDGFCERIGVQSIPDLIILSVAREADVGAEAWAGTGLPHGGNWAEDPIVALPAGFREYRANWTGARSLAGLEWALHTHRRFLTRDHAAQGAAAEVAFDVRGEDAAGVKSLFELDGVDAGLRLADYGAFDDASAEEADAALAEALHIAAGRAAAARGQANAQAEVRADGSQQPGEADEEDDDDEAAEWAAVGDGSEAVLF